MYIGEKENIVLIERFKSYLKDVGYSKSICKSLPAYTADFLSYSRKEPESITQKDIQNFYEWLQIRANKTKEGGLSEAYIHYHIFALKTFFNWLESAGAIKYNPISVLKFKQPGSNSRQPLTQEEIRQLFKAAITGKETAILHLLYSCGLRRNEAVSLNIKDLHFKQQLLYVREGKGAKRRVIPMTSKVARELESYYLEERIEMKARDREAFILDRVTKRMSGDSFNRALKKIIHNTEDPILMSKEITSHHLRHSIATHLLESGLSIEYVRDFLGHSFLESTQIYTKVNQRQLNKL